MLARHVFVEPRDLLESRASARTSPGSRRRELGGAIEGKPRARPRGAQKHGRASARRRSLLGQLLEPLEELAIERERVRPVVVPSMGEYDDIGVVGLGKMIDE